MHNPEHFYEYSTGMIVCGECLDADLLATRLGSLIDDERVYPGMFIRMKDDQVEPYQCDACLKQNAAYEALENEEE
jgi:hypothetical protein